MTLSKENLEELGFSEEDPIVKKFHKEVANKCGPIIEEIAAKYYQNLAPKELGQLLIRDRTINTILFEYDLQQTDWDEIWNEN